MVAMNLVLYLSRHNFIALTNRGKQFNWNLPLVSQTIDHIVPDLVDLMWKQKRSEGHLTKDCMVVKRFTANKNLVNSIILHPKKIPLVAIQPTEELMMQIMGLRTQPDL
jgi:hypothetical protein